MKETMEDQRFKSNGNNGGSKGTKQCRTNNKFENNSGICKLN